MIPWILLIALIVVYSITLPPLLKRAGLNATLGYIPLVNFFPFLKMIKRPWWWFFLLLSPGVNLMMLVIINVELGIAFGKRKTGEQWFFGALPWYALFKLAYQEKEVAFIGPRDWTGKKKSFGREWGEAIVFAVVAASVIRTFFIEAFTIPTPSMEKSMLVGDYLFVSKLSYGPKVPQTPVSIPFVHNAIPGGMTNSYVDWFSLPYFRLPGMGKVVRFDPVVFNFPNCDTIMVDSLGNISRSPLSGNVGVAVYSTAQPNNLLSVVDEAAVSSTLVPVPNPSNGLVSFTTNNTEAGISVVEIFDISGKLTAQYNLKSVKGSYNHVLDLNHLNNGVYLMKVTAAGEVNTARLMIQK